MKTTTTAVATMLTEFGFAKAKNWPVKILNQKVADLADPEAVTEEDLGKLSADSRATYDAILKAHEAGEAVELTSEDAAPARSKRGGKPAAKKAAPVKKAAPAKKAARGVGRPKGDGRPAAGTQTGKVWDIADKLAKTKAGATRAAVVAACEKAGINKSTAGVQFGKWQKAQ